MFIFGVTVVLYFIKILSGSRKFCDSIYICFADTKIGTQCVHVVCLRNVQADFHSVQNIARSYFCDHFLLKCVQSTWFVAFVWLLVFQKKMVAKCRSRDILHWMEICLYCAQALINFGTTSLKFNILIQ
jgi:hypothetical protein